MPRSSTTFQKGQSGNPKGRPKEVADVRAAAQKHTEMAIKTLAEIAERGDSEKARVAAAQALLDRAWGRCPQSVNIGDPDGNPLIPIEAAVAVFQQAGRMLNGPK